MSLKRLAPLKPCRHCATRAGNTGHRGLCVPCYMTPAVRAMYPGERTSGRRGEGNGNAPAVPAGALTSRPGTEERILEMAARAERGEAVFRDGDRDVRSLDRGHYGAAPLHPADEVFTD